MCPNKTEFRDCKTPPVRSIAKQRGSLLVLALFIIIVLTILAGTMMNVVSNSSSSVVNEVFGLRVQQAANAGIQSLVAQSFPIGSTPQVCQTTVSSPSSFSEIPGLQGCSYSARCDSEDIEYLGLDYRYYKFTSTGVCDLSGSVFSRTVSVDAMESL
ncbi:MAG: type II secretory pathway component [Pseudomonadota bacterium]